MCARVNDIHTTMLHAENIASRGVSCYNYPYHNGMRGAFLFIKPGRETHKNTYGQSPPNLGIPQYRCDKRTGSLNYGGFVIMTKGDGLPCEGCGTSDWYKDGHCKRCRYEYNRQWMLTNSGRMREHQRRWRHENIEKQREHTRNWQKNNPDTVNAAVSRRNTRKTEAGGSYTAAEWKALCKQYNGRCACCGKEKPLEFDHVIPVSKGGTSDISNGQPLCRFCNGSKGDKTTDYRTKPGIKRWIQEKLL